MALIIMELKGRNGQIELYEDKVVIKRNGLVAKFTQGFFKGDKTIYLNQITGIELRKPGIFTGYIQFTLPGGIESKSGMLGKNGAVKDENTVILGDMKAYDLAQQLKTEIEKLKAGYSQPMESLKQDGADAIRKYKQLVDDGIITQSEFEAKKKEILGI